MSYHSLMTYVDADRAPEQRIRLAANLADKFNASLIGISALAIQPPVVSVGGVITPEVIHLGIETITGVLTERGKWFRSVATGGQRNVEWRAFLDIPTDALAREARSADLVIIGRENGTGDFYRSLDPGRAILRIGRAVLVVPNGIDSVLAEHIVIGWRDTREARRAVMDSIPFLQAAKRISIVEICGPDEDSTAHESVTDVALYLERHRIKADAKVVNQEGRSVGDQLARIARDEDADLLVTGAYGHTRLGEWIFGGMTRELLHASPMCCLMSH
jgi:nucleotide-binding universal stress UspA family protein